MILAYGCRRSLGSGRTVPTPLHRMGLNRAGGGAAFPQMQEPRGSPSRSRGRLQLVASERELRTVETPGSVERSSHQVRAPHGGHCSDSSHSAANGRAKRCARTAPLPRSRSSPCAPGRRPMRERDRRISDDRRFCGKRASIEAGLDVPVSSKAGVEPEVDVRLPQGGRLWCRSSHTRASRLGSR